MRVVCVSLGGRTSTVLICCLYLILHSAFLVANFVILSRPGEHVESLVSRGR